MSRPFLIGSFLPSHGAAFGRMDPKPEQRAFTASDLEPRMQARTAFRLKRRSAYRTSILTGMALAIGLTVFAVNLRLVSDTDPSMHLWIRSSFKWRTFCRRYKP